MNAKPCPVCGRMVAADSNGAVRPHVVGSYFPVEKRAWCPVAYR